MPSSFARATPSTRDILAGLCAADARHDAALQLSGAAEAQAERSGLKRGSAANAFLLRSIEQSRSALGAAAADALSEGREWASLRRCGAPPSCFQQTLRRPGADVIGCPWVESEVPLVRTACGDWNP